MFESATSLLVDVDLLPANELMVYPCRELTDAQERLQHMTPDVIVAVLPVGESPSILPGLRGVADYGTSIIVASVSEEREAARKAGADSFLLNSAPPADVLYEIRRALILRRSRRRLPWKLVNDLGTLSAPTQQPRRRHSLGDAERVRAGKKCITRAPARSRPRTRCRSYKPF